MSLSGSLSGSSSGSSPWFRRKRALLDNLLSFRSAKKAKQSEVSVSPPSVSESPSFTDHEIDSELSLEDAQDLVDDWVMVRPSDERKQLAVALFVTYRRRQGMGVTQAAQEAGSVSGFNERTVRRYWKEWCNNGGSFDDSVQGKYQRDTIVADEELRRQA